MKKLKVLRDGYRTYTNIIWNVPIEYDGNKYVIVVNEDDHGVDRTLYHYDEDRRYFVGEEVDGDLAEQLYEDIIESMCEAGIMYSDVEEGHEIIVHDDEEE